MNPIKIQENAEENSKKKILRKRQRLSLLAVFDLTFPKKSSILMAYFWVASS